MRPTAQALARTYSDRNYTDPWEKVRDYRRVQRYTAEHPNHGRVRTGNALELPPSRIRGWMNGGMPDPVRGIHTATDHGWIDPTTERAANLVRLLAHVLAGGSIAADTYVPAVSTARRVDAGTIDDAFSRLGVPAVSRHSDTDGRTTELIPGADASVLGRCLVAMGAPRGEKVGLDTFPAVIQDATPELQRSVAQIYLAHRAITHPGKQTLTIREARSQTYLRALQSLLTTVTGETVTVGDQTVTLSAAAARSLRSDQIQIE